jgi:plasmid stability protein
MAQLVVRNIEAEVKERLVQRARRHGRSMEEEVRVILRHAVGEELASKAAPERGLGTRLVDFFAKHGFDEDIEELKGEEARPASFD